jgi:hypothetical protein
VKPLTKFEDIRHAFSELRAMLRHGCRGPLRRTVGWQGGNREFPNIWWNDRHQFWMLFDPKSSGNRYWCTFGLENPVPSRSRMLKIICEVNPPYHGINRRCAGLFVVNRHGVVYLTHSGQIGGGHKGVGKHAFLRHYHGPTVTVDWPDRKTKAIPIGRINDPNLPGKMAAFVRQVAAFKHGPIAAKRISNTERDALDFQAEFAGRYLLHVSLNKRVQREHGQVVNSLRKLLEDLDYHVGNDKHRDLVLSRRGKRWRALFEAKTATRNSSIYTGVGQLLIHSLVGPKIHRLVMVLPQRPRGRMVKILEHWGIAVLIYRKRGREIRFPNLDEILE